MKKFTKVQREPQLTKAHQGESLPKDKDNESRFWSLYRQWKVLADQFEKNSELWNPKSRIPSEDLDLLNQGLKIADNILQELKRSNSN